MADWPTCRECELGIPHFHRWHFSEVGHWPEEWADHHTLESLWRSEITEREAEDEHAALVARDGWEDDGERGRR